MAACAAGGCCHRDVDLGREDAYGLGCRSAEHRAAFALQGVVVYRCAAQGVGAFLVEKLSLGAAHQCSRLQHVESSRGPGYDVDAAPVGLGRALGFGVEGIVGKGSDGEADQRCALAEGWHGPFAQGLGCSRLYKYVGSEGQQFAYGGGNGAFASCRSHLAGHGFGFGRSA